MIIKEMFSKFKGNSRTNCTFLEFQEFSRTKVVFKVCANPANGLLCYGNKPVVSWLHWRAEHGKGKWK